jgi:hypothetical protein
VRPRPGTVRRFATLLLLVPLVWLTPLAHASPPDQTWIGGFYDDADYDDVVLLVTGGLHAVQAPPIPVLAWAADVVAFVPTTPQSTPLEPVPLSEAGRAPPLS